MGILWVALNHGARCSIVWLCHQGLQRLCQRAATAGHQRLRHGAINLVELHRKAQRTDRLQGIGHVIQRVVGARRGAVATTVAGFQLEAHRCLFRGLEKKRRRSPVLAQCAGAAIGIECVLGILNPRVRGQ